MGARCRVMENNSDNGKMHEKRRVDRPSVGRVLDVMCEKTVWQALLQMALASKNQWMCSEQCDYLGSGLMLPCKVIFYLLNSELMTYYAMQLTVLRCLPLRD